MSDPEPPQVGASGSELVPVTTGDLAHRNQAAGQMAETPAAELERRDSAPAGAFAFFSLEGDRFNAPGMPAESAREIAAFRAALLEIAVVLWKQEHPGKRAPNGFAEAFDLRLTGIGEGSARPTLELSKPARGVSDEDWTKWVAFYERARDMATQDVQEVERTEAVPAHVTPKIRKALSRVGSTLDATERIRLGAPSAGSGRASFTPRVRRVLQAVPEPPAPTARAVAEVGVLGEYDGESLSFLLRTDDGRRVKCVLEHFNEPLARRAREYLALDGVTAPDVRVEGQTQDDPAAPPKHIYGVHNVEVVWTLAEKVMVRRLREVTSLEPGWLGPGTDAPEPELADLLMSVVSDLVASGLVISIVPNAEGSIVLEWRAGDVEYTAELAADRTLFLVDDNIVTDQLTERETPYDEDLLRRFLRDGVLQ